MAGGSEVTNVKQLLVNKSREYRFREESDMQTTAEKIWGSAQQHLRTLLNSDLYNLWFAPVQAMNAQSDVLTLGVANDFCEVWLKDNYLDLIREVVAQTSGQPWQIEFRIAPHQPHAPAANGTTQEQAPAADDLLAVDYAASGATREVLPFNP